MKQSGARQASLKWSLIGMVLVCWVLPVLLVVAGAGCYIYRSLETKAKEDLDAAARTAMQMVTARLDAAVASSRMASYIPAVKDAYVAYTRDGSEVDLYERVNTYLYQQYKYDEKFLTSIVTFSEMPQRPFYIVNTTAGGSVQGFRRYADFVRDDALALSPALGTRLAILEQGGHLFMARNLVDSSYTPFAVVVMELNTDMLFREFAAMGHAQQVTVWLSGGEVSLLGAPLPRPQTTDGIFVTRQADSFLLEASAETETYTLQCAVRVLPHALHSQQQAALFTLVAVGLLLLPLTGLVLRFFSRKVTQPVSALMEAAGEIEQGHFGAQVSAPDLTSREMQRLGSSFNRMSDTLQNQFDRIYKEEIALRDARIMALQSQINPHFLNNTLEIINWEARMNGDLKVCDMLESLSTMLSAAMDRRRRPLVHLSEELMYADAYLYIIRERLGKRLSVEKQIDPALLDAPVPRLVLQPIMENAVEHGINPTQKGTIILRAQPDAECPGWMLLEIENDGVITPEDLSCIRMLLSDDPAKDGEPSTSLGIRNVHQRLRILYGPESGLFVNINKKGHTVFTMRIDTEQQKQENATKSNPNH